MKTFDFILSDPIKYQAKGENTEASLLELSAPAVNNRKKVAKLKQGFMRVINGLQNPDAKAAEGKKGNEKIKPEEIMALIQMGIIEYDEYIDIFVSLLISGVCKVDGEVDITQHMVNKISFEDMEKLMGEYLINFIVGSLGE